MFPEVSFQQILQSLQYIFVFVQLTTIVSVNLRCFRQKMAVWLVHLVKCLLSNYTFPGFDPQLCKDLNIYVTFFSPNHLFHAAFAWPWQNRIILQPILPYFNDVDYDTNKINHFK